ncbi:MAG: hypothetical protein LBS59_02840 [Puniceicoccales bacterium]|jgi:hypothetical protein|nr:hypothetical protein [Puniceicoccales bacterium]
MREIFESLFSNLRYVAALLGGTALASRIFLVDSVLLTVFAVGFIVTSGLFFVYEFVKKARRKKAEKSLADQLSGNSAATPGGVSDAARRAQLDDLRQNFLNGLTKFRAAGKSLYNLPWYMVVGEPGSGKTEAIRRCNVDFPPGLQDEMQGSGGTINMHWWFTNQAVLLDTAGKLLFSETPAGTTTEWTEFLNLLRKNRPNCPVNGLLLVIPTDTLLRDSAEELSKKAGKIAEQLDRIQRTLDVRFPVFVLLTKCDLLNGFREFFADIKDPQLQHQMTGWSNPDPLDTPFDPVRVNQHFDVIKNTVSRRRLALMLDPAANSENGRRADEVDSLFSLPTSIDALVPRLRRYLEIVFTAGEWSSKPLFLRGIYFTSALTEGKALDMELARAMGVTPDSLPDGKIFERERSFFLRDLFIQKIFQEKGLVTRASSASRQIRRRQLIIGGTTTIGISGLLALSIWGAFSVRDSVGIEKSYWKAAAAHWTTTHEWNPIVSPEFQGASKYTYNGGNTIVVGSEKIPLVEYHTRLQSLVTRDIPVPIVFAPLNAVVVQANTGRREAQRIIFDTSVTRPLVEAARVKMLDIESPWTARETAALAALIQLEGIIHYPSIKLTRVQFEPGKFITPLLSLWIPDNKIPAALNNVFDWTEYSGSGAGIWPDKTFSAGETLHQNAPVLSGLNRFRESKGGIVRAQAQNAATLAAVRKEGLAWQNAEKEFVSFAGRPANTPGWLADVNKTFPALDAAGIALDKAFENARAAGFFPEDKPASLAAAVNRSLEDTRQNIGRELVPLREVVGKFRPPSILNKATDAVGSALTSRAPAALQTIAVEAEAQSLAAKGLSQQRSAFSPNFPMLQEVTTVLDQIAQDAINGVTGVLGNAKPEDIARLDKESLDLHLRGPLYQTRHQVFKNALALFTLPPETGDTLVGNLYSAFDAADGRANSVTAVVSGYDRALVIEFRAVAQNLTKAGRAASNAALCDLYADKIADGLAKNAAFPVFLDSPPPSMSADALRKLASFIRDAQKDTHTLAEKASPKQRDLVRLTADRIKKVASILDVFINKDDTLAPVKIVVPDRSVQQTVLGRSGIVDFNQKFAGNIWRTLRLGTSPVRVPDSASTRLEPILTLKVADTFPTLELFHGADAKSTPDAFRAFSQPWTSISLIASAKGVIRKNDGYTWLAPITITDTSDAKSAEYFLALQFQFEKPLPELSDWPTLKTLQLEKTKE